MIRLTNDMTEAEKVETQNTNNNLLNLGTAKTAAGKPGILYAGVIRNSGSGWAFIADSIHDDINFTTISETANNEIKVDFEDALKVGSMVVCPDETLASYGLTCGASVGDNTALIKCYAPFTGYINGAGTIIGNSWFSGAYTVLALSDGTGFTITYDGGGNTSEKVLANIIRDAAAPHSGLDIRAARNSAAAAILRAYHDFYAYVYYDGSAWQVATSCVAGISCSFDSGTGVLTILHDSMASAAGYNEFQSCNMTPRYQTSGGIIHPRIHSVTPSQIKVVFYDNAGTLITTPNTNMRIYITRPGFRVPHVWNTGCRAYFDFGMSLVRPGKLISTSGNLWILGLHQAN